MPIFEWVIMEKSVCCGLLTGQLYYLHSPGKSERFLVWFKPRSRDQAQIHVHRAGEQIVHFHLKVLVVCTVCQLLVPFFCLPLCVAEAFCSLSNSTITLLYVLRGLESKSTRYTIQKVNRRLLLIGVVSLYWFQRAHCNLKSFSVLVSFFYITSVVLSVSMHRTNVFC